MARQSMRGIPSLGDAMQMSRQRYAGVPIFLTAEGDLSPGTQSPTNFEALRNPTDFPLEISEIRFMYSNISPAGGPYVFLSGGEISCRLAVGNVEITDADVALWSFGRRDGVMAQEYLAPSDFFIVHSTGPAAYDFSQYIWRPERPLIIPPGKALQPAFTYRGAGAAVAANVRISAAGRTAPHLKQLPAQIEQPYVSNWIAKPIAYMDADVDRSPETILRNRFKTPIKIHRIIGRVTTRSATLIEEGAQEYSSARSSDLNFTEVAQRMYSIKMNTSKGEDIIREYVDWRNVFSAGTGCWDLAYILEPQQYITVYLNKQSDESETDASIITQAFVSIVGTRTVNTEDI